MFITTFNIFYSFAFLLLFARIRCYQSYLSSNILHPIIITLHTSADWCLPAKSGVSMSSMPAVGSVPPHLSSNTPLFSTTQLDVLYMIIIHPEPVLPTIPPLQPSPPYYLKIYPQSLLAGNVWTCQYNLLYLRPGATLHVLLTSCMKCPSTPPPHGNNTYPQSIFGQKPVSLSMSSLPAV